MALRDCLVVVWRRRWVAVLIVVAAAAGAYSFSSRQAKQYETQSTIAYLRQIDLSDPLGTGDAGDDGLDRQMASIDGALKGPELARRVAALLEQDGSVDASAGFRVSAAPEESSSSGGSTNIAVFTGASSDATLAAAAANAAAEAYVAWSAQLRRDQIGKAIAAIQGQLGEQRTEDSATPLDSALLRRRLQELRVLEDASSTGYRVLARASVPTEPVAPKPRRGVILGLGIGLLAGLGVVFLAEQFDPRIHRSDEVSGILCAPVLGRLPRISRRRLRQDALVTVRRPTSGDAEAFRTVRAGLSSVASNADVKSVVVTSCAAGEGKSLTVANLAVSMAMVGRRVIVVDANLRHPRLHDHFDVGNEKGLSTVAAGRDALLETLVRVEVESPAGGAYDSLAAGAEACPCLYVLPSGPLPPNPGEVIAPRRLGPLLEELRGEADLVLVDAPALFASADSAAIAAMADGLLLLVQVRAARRRQLVAASQWIEQLPVCLAGAVLRA